MVSGVDGGNVVYGLFQNAIVDTPVGYISPPKNASVVEGHVPINTTSFGASCGVVQNAVANVTQVNGVSYAEIRTGDVLGTITVPLCTPSHDLRLAVILNLVLSSQLSGLLLLFGVQMVKYLPLQRIQAIPCSRSPTLPSRGQLLPVSQSVDS